jgi:hypothetical protein
MKTGILGFILVLAAGTQSCPVVEYPRHHVMLRVVRVIPDWHGYDISGGGWPSAVSVKESDVLKYFEAAIWEETQSIHLYEFDNEFDPHYGLGSGVTPQQMTKKATVCLCPRITGWTSRKAGYVIRTVVHGLFQS